MEKYETKKCINFIRGGGPLLGAFTMAEILLSLTIIGVVAAITLPSLTGNINERTWNTQRKALYARFSQAIALMPSLNGFGTLSGTIDASGSQTISEDNVAETFITSGLSKVLKINNICDSEHTADCGINSTFVNLQGTKKDMPLAMDELNTAMISASDPSGYNSITYKALKTKAAAFETQNGESILLFYNPTCVSNMGETWDYNAQPKVCVNMVYDLNGTKGPNTVGKDIGVMTIFYPTDSVVVAPIPFRTTVSNVTSANAGAACTEHTKADYRIPTKEETLSVALNKEFFGLIGHLFTSTKRVVSYSATPANWVVVSSLLQYRVPAPTAGWSALCVQR
ncbi:MAG: type II secretion system GspH family protein [Fusobacterium sp.]|nr:type II secretion system GspH family protein [Fusobacterium sp.]